MACSQTKVDSKLPLEIKTKSVEQTLVPLVTQITTLVNHKDRPRVSERSLKALVRVGQAVNLAVERFVTVGESIGDENAEIKMDMCEACKEARSAGVAIQRLTDVQPSGQLDSLSSFAEKTAMVKAARQLLSAITKVLVLADRVVIKQIIASKNKVSASLSKLEGVSSFTEFVRAFSQFGNEMVELAHLTGDRQNDLKSDRDRARIAAARSVLEKSTMMLLTSSKTFLRHPECESARQCRDTVIAQMHKAMQMMQTVVESDCGSSSTNGKTSPRLTQVNGDSGIGLSIDQHLTTHRAIQEFDDLVEMTRVTLVSSNTQDKLTHSLDQVSETVQDFTDSAYTTHEHRERILLLCEKIRQELSALFRYGVSMNQKENTRAAQDFETAIIRTKDSARALRKQLLDTAMDQTSEMFRSNDDHELLLALKTAGLSGDVAAIDELGLRFEEHSEQLQELAKLLHHIATTEPLMIVAEHTEGAVKSLAPQVIFAAKTLALNPASKIAKETLDVFSDSWSSQINDVSSLVKDVSEICQGRREKQVYSSLPRPGKHGTTQKGLKPARLDAEEQAKIAKVGLEMKLITSEMDAETEKWEEPDNELVRRARNMSSMAFSMYLFTRGEGPLKTTQDLFTQADYFAEEGNKLFRIVKDFSSKVPNGNHCNELLAHLDQVPPSCQQLSLTLKAPTFGKAATFNKVDSVIQDTKNLMNAVSKVVTTCFICATKYEIDYREMSQRWRHMLPLEIRTDGDSMDQVRMKGPDNYGRSNSLTRPLPSSRNYDQL